MTSQLVVEEKHPKRVSGGSPSVPDAFQNLIRTSLIFSRPFGTRSFCCPTLDFILGLLSAAPLDSLRAGSAESTWAGYPSRYVFRAALQLASMGVLSNLKIRTKVLLALLPLALMVIVAALYTSTEMEKINSWYGNLID